MVQNDQKLVKSKDDVSTVIVYNNCKYNFIML